ncbi:hypothetical protein AM571_CH01947 [Rhizobium etli 8C-3]|uniref:Uncharacterized protein n=1 Tax=Rhizobium etli 8C-3 TaxID=538025 RepID=A0A1L5P3N4_RHIET|nr:hypothetical protein [Rhizobium etli]APO74759.1 hypothetical protein AM571_CH01947 [Rhizobium etli 8C-3]
MTAAQDDLRTALVVAIEAAANAGSRSWLNSAPLSVRWSSLLRKPPSMVPRSKKWE